MRPMLSADELVVEFSDTNNSWESMLTHELAEEIIGRTLSNSQWAEMRDTLDDVVFDTVMGFQYD